MAYLTGGGKLITMQSIIHDNMKDYTDLAKNIFREQCYLQFLNTFKDLTPGAARAWFNKAVHEMRHVICTADLLSRSIQYSEQERAELQTLQNSLALDFESVGDSEKDYFGTRARLGETLIKAVSAKTKINSNILTTVNILQKKEVDTDKIEIMRNRNEIIDKQGDSVQDQIKAQLESFRNLQQQITNTADTGTMEIDIIDEQQAELLPEDSQD